MISGNIIIAFVLMQYALFFLSLRDKDTKRRITQNNARIEELRRIQYKSVEEQKEFLTLKYGTGLTKAKWTLKDWVYDALKGTLAFLLFFIPLQLVRINNTYFRPNLWLTLILSIIITMLINKHLMKYGLQRQDGIDTLFR